MAKRQLFEKANFGALTNKIGGKLTLEAVDYDFELSIYKLSDNGEKKTFIDPVSVPLQRGELLDFQKGVLEAFAMEFNRVKFKVKEIITDTTFADIRFTTRGLFVIRLIGKYLIQDGRKNRKTTLKVYKLGDWNEVKQFNLDPNNFEGNLIASYEFEPAAVTRGSFVYRDIVAIEELTEVISDCYFKRNCMYNEFLVEVTKEKQAAKQDSGNNGYGQHYKPNSVVPKDSEDSDEYPWD
ncbi:MAG: hypothetical protein ACRCX2_20810 [Paraclostridium sp.]